MSGSYQRIEKAFLVDSSSTCSASMGGWNENIYVQSCHWLASNAAFTMRITVSPMHAQANRDRRRWQMVTLRK